MGQRAFDILPPYPKDEPRTYHHHGADKTKKEKVKSRHNFLIFLFGLFFIIILFGFVKLENFNGSTSVSKTTNPPATNNTTSNNQFELFDSQGESGLATDSQPIRVRLLDGATKTDNATTAKALLLKNSFIIEKQDKATNIYSQTIIYYKKGKITLGQTVSDTLKSGFSPILQESSGLDASYDVLVIIGDK